MLILLWADGSSPWISCVLGPLQPLLLSEREGGLQAAGCRQAGEMNRSVSLIISEKNIWGSLSLPSRFKPDLGLFRTFGVDLSTSPGCGCSHTSPIVGPVGIEPTLTTCKSSGLTARPAGPWLSLNNKPFFFFLFWREQQN